MSYYYREIYPHYDKDDEKTLYYIEFLQFDKNDKLRWTLFKRNFLMSKGEFNEVYRDDVKEGWVAFQKEVLEIIKKFWLYLFFKILILKEDWHKNCKR